MEAFNIKEEELDKIEEKAENFIKYRKNFVEGLIVGLILFILFCILIMIQKTNKLVIIILSFLLFLNFIFFIKNIIQMIKNQLKLKDFTIFKIEKLIKLFRDKNFNENKRKIKSLLFDLVIKYSGYYENISKNSLLGFEKIKEIKKFMEGVYDTLNYYNQKDTFDSKEKKELISFLKKLEEKVYKEDFDLKGLKIKTPEKIFDFSKIIDFLKKEWVILILSLILSFIITLCIFGFKKPAELYHFVLSFCAITGLIFTIYKLFLKEKLNN